MLMIVSLISPGVLAQDVNSALKEKQLEDTVERGDPVYSAIDTLYSNGYLSEDSYAISKKHNLTRYEIALLVSSPLVTFMSSEDYANFDLDVVKAVNYVVKNYPSSLNALGFNAEIVGNIEEMAKNVLIKEEQTAKNQDQKANKAVNYNPENLSRSRIAEIQYILGQIGLYKGEIDGLFGKMTKSAIETYQKEVGLKVNGILNSELYSSLLENLDVPENFTNLAQKELKGNTIQPKNQPIQSEVVVNNRKSNPKETKSNLINNVEIHGSTNIEYEKVDTSGDVPLDEDDEPIYEEEDTFKQVFNLDIIGHISDGVELVANLKAENEDGLLSEDSNLSLEEVRLVGLQDDINKFIVGSQPSVNFGNLSYQSKGENGFSWMHNGENYSLYTLYAIKDHTFDEDGNEIPLPYKRNTFGIRVATEKLAKNLKLGLNILNTRDKKVNNSYSETVLPNKKALTVASLTSDYSINGFEISNEIAVMKKNKNVNSDEDNVTAFATIFDISKTFADKLTASLQLRKVDKDYNAETLVDENAYYKDSDLDEIENPYNPGETGGTLNLAYSEGNFSGDLTLEYWNIDKEVEDIDEDANTEKGFEANLNYSKDNWSVNYNAENWNDDGDGYKVKTHELTGNYQHEFTKEVKNDKKEKINKKFATVSLTDTINYEDDETIESPAITTNTFTLATEITPIDDMVINMEYENVINDNKEDKVKANKVDFAINKKFKINDKFIATPYYNASIDNGHYDNPETEDYYDPYEVESIVQNVGVDTETMLIEEELKVLASLSYNNLKVTKGKLDEDGYYISGNEPKDGIEAMAGVRWTPKSIKILKGLDLTVQAGKKVYDYKHKDSDKDQDSWSYSVGVGYNKQIADYGEAGIFYNRSEDIDDIEEYETTSEEYGLNASVNVGENTSINANISETRNIDKSQDKDLKIVNNTIGITTRPVGADGPSINFSFTEEKHQDELKTDDNYSVREIKGTVGGSF
jgi:peptidoglycan hydrolase-like protein with peptidoglycan-binding domain